MVCEIDEGESDVGDVDYEDDYMDCDDDDRGVCDVADDDGSDVYFSKAYDVSEAISVLIQ